MKKNIRKLSESFLHAFRGLRLCIHDERNFRVHMTAAFYVTAAAVMGLAVWAVYGLLDRFLGNTLSTLGAICVGVLVYAVLVVALRTISREDLSLMPKGDKIAKILRL